MTIEIKLPELGENLQGGEVLDVKVAAGDMVAEGQTLLEVEAEKSNVEVPSPRAGRVGQVMVKKGDAVQVGQALITIDDGPRQQEPAAKTPLVRVAAEAPKKDPQPPKDEKPQQQEQPAQAPAPPAKVPAAVKGDGRVQEAHAPQAAPSDGEKVVPAGPATRRLARELGVDLGQVPASAPGGRVTQEDVKSYVKQLASGTAGRTSGAPPLPDFERWGLVERQPLDGVRRKTAEQMSLAWSLVPHVTQNDQADVTDLDAFRRQQDGNGPKLTVTAFALKAAAIALKQFPRFNASLDTAAGQLILKRYYHIGVAVDTDRGLLVPVIRDVDKKSVQELAQELTTVSDKARNKKLQADEMRGGTFTITNLGSIGGTGFSPIVNYPEVAILGLSRARWQPVVRGAQVVPRLILPLSLSYDHRVIDGADAARFTRRLADMLENPLVMLLHA